MKKIKVQAGLFFLFLMNLALNFSGLHLRMLLMRQMGCSFGRRSSIHGGTTYTWIGNISIKDSTTVNRGCFIDNRGLISIGTCSMVGHACKIYTAGHHYNDPHFLTIVRPVSVGSYCIIYPNCILLPGVDLPDGVVVLPGSVVYPGKYEEGDILWGNPAKVKGRRKEWYRSGFDYRFYFPNS